MTIAQLPEDDILQRLANTTCEGTFEAHITIHADDLRERGRFREFCREAGVKCVLIELPEGVTRSQPMTASYHQGKLAGVLAEVAALGRRVREGGFVITRLKLEAVATNDGLPETDEEARKHPANYFEFHVKLILPRGCDLDELRRLCAEHQARLSSNALKVDGGEMERFITLRLYGLGRTSAFRRCDGLVRELTSGGYRVANYLREYTIYDSAVTLDAGWIDPPRGGEVR
jgi:hypothetical protein